MKQEPIPEPHRDNGEAGGNPRASARGGRQTAELQKELDARGDNALYREITLRFSWSPQGLPVLTQMLVQVYDSTGGASEQGEASPAARDLAHRMGQLQAQTLLSFAFRSGDDPVQHVPEPPTAAAVRDAGDGAQTAVRPKS